MTMEFAVTVLPPHTLVSDSSFSDPMWLLALACALACVGGTCAAMTLRTVMILRVAICERNVMIGKVSAALAAGSAAVTVFAFRLSKLIVDYLTQPRAGGDGVVSAETVAALAQRMLVMIAVPSVMVAAVGGAMVYLLRADGGAGGRKVQRVIRAGLAARWRRRTARPASPGRGSR
ncbi:hypothetical protein [Mycolicibacterium neoaurum]|uniref:hypothetical protein n=1 Tax=Mycolicibacterium neoaurum TaxID=1795 RepID=UPI001F4C63F7|nr:hypothetical protein [Mycolicibacterium neoaurum]